MKKVSLILCTLLAAVLLLAGCTPAAPAATKAPVATEQPADTQAAAATEAPAASGTPAIASSNGTPSGSFGAFTTMKGNALTRITDKIGDNSELATYSMTMLPFSVVDLALLPVTALTGGDAATQATVAETALGMLGMKDVKIAQAGGKYTVSYTGGDSKKGSLTCEYDAATDSMHSEVTDDSGKVVLISEYVKVGKGYAAQYFDVEDSGSQVLTVFFDDSTVSAFGIKNATAAPKSIFKNASQTIDIVKSADTYLILQDGKLTVHDQGADKTY